MSWQGLLHLKPFDESGDADRTSLVYTRSPFVGFGIVVSNLLSFISLALVIAGQRWALQVLAVAVAASAITAGLEWHNGLHARALNQLFVALLLAVLLALVCRQVGQ